MTVNLKNSISKLGRILFHNNSYVRWPFIFTESSALLANGEKLIFLRENAVLILCHSLISIKHKIPCKNCII